MPLPPAPPPQPHDDSVPSPPVSAGGVSALTLSAGETDGTALGIARAAQLSSVSSLMAADSTATDDTQTNSATDAAAAAAPAVRSRLLLDGRHCVDELAAATGVSVRDVLQSLPADAVLLMR